MEAVDGRLKIAVEMLSQPIKTEMRFANSLSFIFFFFGGGVTDYTLQTRRGIDAVREINVRTPPRNILTANPYRWAPKKRHVPSPI